MAVTGSWIVDSLLLLSVLLFLLYRYLSSVYGYFRSQGVPYLAPIPLVGHTWLFTLSQTDVACRLYESFPDEKFFGFFQSVVPTFVIKDPELIHQIMVKDFNHFYDRGFASIERDILLSKNLFNIRGQPWRSLRNKLTPTFTSGKIKHMFEQLVKSGEHLLENIDKQLENACDAKVISVEYGTEVIASTAFGIDFSRENPQTKEFIEKATKGLHNGVRLNLTLFLAAVAPKLANLLPISMFKPGTMEYFANLIKATKEYRKHKNIRRNDYFDLLLRIQEAEESGKCADLSLAVDSNEDDTMINQMQYASDEVSQGKEDFKLISNEVVSAQAFVFLIAGSDSISGTLSFAMYHIAKNPEIQKRLSNEIETVIAKQGEWDYNAVKNMVYLDQIVQETLRMYPMVASLFRECTLPYRIPNTNVCMEKGTKVIIPIFGLQHDPKYYPDPEVFNPERFVNNNYKPSPTYMPFGDGPRICIAMRFAIVEVKVCLAKIFSRFSVSVNSKTQEPFVFDKESFVPRPVGGIWVNFKRKTK